MKSSLILVCTGALLASLSASAATTKVAATKQAPRTTAPRAKKPPLIDPAGGQGYGMAGCGLGSIIFGEQPGFIQILAATTNDWAGTQTFGISTGSSNCAEGGTRTASMFIDANRDALQKEISRGNGETVASLAHIMGCSDTAAFGRTLQANFRTIFPTQSAATNDVVNSIVSTVKGDEQLSHACANVG